MINTEHYNSVLSNNKKLLKQNTQLHAQISHLNAEIEKFKQDTIVKLSGTIRLYDRHNDKVMAYLRDNNLVSPEHLKEIAKLFPIKIK